MDTKSMTPTPAEMAMYLDRAHRARSEAFTALGRQLFSAVRGLIGAGRRSSRTPERVAAGARAKVA